ncbi:MAG: radical SAM family heme chaperone HemW [Candidatus Scatovivens sp.]
MKELGIYVHIPFCKRKCEYCDFISFENKYELIENYIETLILEMENESKKISKEQYEITTIYFGGGTPSFIDSKYIIQILDKIKQNFNLSNPEITIEINPGTVDENKLKKYFENGINRISIGLQETDNKLLNMLGRIHRFEEFLNTYNLARNVGFKNINVDLMIGLPNQTLNNINESLNKIIDINPEHISVYSLILEDNTKLKQKIERGELVLPSEELERKMYWNVKEKLEKNNYNQYEISNFSKQGFESKHNINCWKQKEYLGFGLAAHSYFNNVRYANVHKLEEYIESEGSDKIIEERQTREETMKEYMLLGLRKINGVSISEFEQKFGIHPLFYFRFEISKLVEEELLEIDLDNIRLTKKGLDLANQVFQEFV